MVFSYPLLALKTRLSTRSTVGARMLPPKLYLVVFYQVSLVNWTRITCLDFRSSSVLFLGNFVVPYHMFIPPWGSCNKCSSMIVSVNDSVSQNLFVSPIIQGVFCLGYYWLLNKRLIISEFFTQYLQSWGGRLGIQAY